MCWRCLCANRTQEMDSARKMDQEYLFGCPRQKLEVVSCEADIGFGFSAEKRLELAILMYFSKSGRPKTDIRKFSVYLGARGMWVMNIWI